MFHRVLIIHIVTHTAEVTLRFQLTAVKLSYSHHLQWKVQKQIASVDVNRP